MSLSEDQLRKDLASAPDDWPKRMKLVERLADRWAGQEMDMLLTASPNAPATEAEMRRVVDLANAHCPGYRGLKHVLGLFLGTHLTSSWAHFIQAQAEFHTGEEEAALRHYQTSKSLNPARSDEELERLLYGRGIPPVAAEPESEPVVEPAPAKPARRTPVPVPPKQEIAGEPISEEPAGAPDNRTVEDEGIPDREADSPPAAEEPAGPESGDSAGEAEKENSRLAPPEEKEAEVEDTKNGSDPGPSDQEGAGKPESEKGADETDLENSKSGKEEEEKGAEAGSKEAGKKKDSEQDQSKETVRVARKTGEEADDPDSPIHLEPLGMDGELITAAKKEDDSRERLSALSIALIAHVVILSLFAFWQVVKARPTPPNFVSSVVTKGDEQRPNRPEIKRYQRPRMPSATAKMHVMTAPVVSSVTMPEMEKSVATFDPVGNGDDFGLSMSFGGGGGGSVSFFGSKATSNRVVFVVDVSASMGGSKDLLMRKELTKSIEALPPSVEYALIFFGGPAWYAGQQVGEAGPLGDWKANIVRDGSRRYVWYEGWSKDQRVGLDGISALYHYALGENNLPLGPYQKATKTNKQRTVQQIQETPLVFGTDWRWPLRMAMNMKADTIFFMTDGAFGTGPGVTKEEMIQGLLEHNRRTGNARINTVCMMVLQARKELEQLARGSQGEFTLVLQDGSVVRGSELDAR